MKKVGALYGFYLLLMVVSQSCRPEHYRITGIKFSGATIAKRDAEMQANYYTPTDTFTNDIVFVVSYKAQYLYGMNASVGEKCYATTVPTVYDNSMLSDLDSIKFDRPFTYRGETFPANTNILANWKVRRQVAIFENNMTFNGGSADKVFEFTPDFTSNAVFEQGIYEVTFTCHTSDNQKFEKTIEVRFDN